jgi:hypothetical protein
MLSFLFRESEALGVVRYRQIGRAFKYSIESEAF